MNNNNKKLISVLNNYAKKFQELYKKQLDSKDINASKNLYNSINMEVKKNNYNYTVAINLEDYWEYVENGRRPGKMPPVDKIVTWMGYKKSFKRMTVKKKKQVAFSIAKKISKYGTKGKGIMKYTMETLFNEFKSEIGKALKVDLDSEVYKIISEPIDTKIIKINNKQN